VDLKVIEAMEKQELRKYLEFLLWHYRVADAFWFLYVEEEFGVSTAEKLNQRVWGKAASMAAKNLKKRFNIEEKRAPGFREGVASVSLDHSRRIQDRRKA